ncbi:MAG: type II toxin-antitoxin system Phd/YefM family antitoxin [Armatimonadota bacterium]|nr:type II toxin-antitoxin system Phd/YefM family antitoxin [Armatimonadota bacterium]MDR7434820.1 type II toxin-antitoxin system Phd/YefM family antitoxin [Armatimonadota bacterium]
MVLDKIVQVSEFKKRPAKFLEEVRSGTPITITQGKRADCILVSRDTWARLLARLEELEAEVETLELLIDPKVRGRLAAGLPERGVTLEEARKLLEASSRK